MDKDINRIKVVLAEKKRTIKWLDERTIGMCPYYGILMMYQ